MSDQTIRHSLNNLERALERLREALDEPQSNALVIDGTIQRFEFAIELFWKTLKRMLAAEGIQTATPKETLKEAYKVEWLDDETLWLRMLRDRNETSHIYDEETARRIYANIREYYPEMRRVGARMKNRLHAHSVTGSGASDADG